MADLSITATQVLPGTGAVYGQGISGVAITAGQAVYLDSSTNTIKLADANASQAAAAAVGIASHGCAAGQPVRYQNAGLITLGAGAAPTQGVLYVVSATAGGIAPAADLASGWYVTVLGVGAGSNQLKMHLFVSGVVV